MVVDFSDLDHWVQNVTLGESFSPFYRDQFEAWYHGRGFSMPFGGKAVRKAAVHGLALKPVGAN
jgi:penicillin G amidase